MSIRSRVASVILGPELKRLSTAFSIMREAYETGPYQLPPQELVRQLKEQDPWLLQDAIDQMLYETIGGMGSVSIDAERMRAVNDSMLAYRRDVITEFTVKLWTNFGFGNTVNVTPTDEDAQAVLEEFWTAKRNAGVLSDDNIQTLSEIVLVQGEQFIIAFVSLADGTCTIRSLGNDETPGTKQITKIVTDPNDETTNLFYLREWIDGNGKQQKLYYPDWQAFLDGTLDNATLVAGIDRADNNDKTIAVMMHIAHNRKGGKRGWPLMTAGIKWTRMHKAFREDRAAAAAAIAMFVNKVKVKGGSRAVNAEYAKLASAYQTGATQALDSNPPPVAGSTRFENESATMERMPMGTGASDAKEDGNALMQMSGLGGGLYPVWLGNGDTNALASARSMEKPMERQFSRYQTFWSAQWRKLVDLVLSMSERYGGKTFETHDAEVSLDQLVQSDLAGIVDSVSRLIDATLATVEKAGTDPTPIPAILSTVWGLAFDALGVEDQDAITPQAFGATPVSDGTTTTEPEALPIPDEVTEVDRAAFEDALSQIVGQPIETAPNGDGHDVTNLTISPLIEVTVPPTRIIQQGTQTIEAKPRSYTTTIRRGDDGQIESIESEAIE